MSRAMKLSVSPPPERLSRVKPLDKGPARRPLGCADFNFSDLLSHSACVLGGGHAYEGLSTALWTQFSLLSPENQAPCPAEPHHHPCCDF